MSDLLNHRASADYSADSIEVLEDVEHVRLRPAMYIGSTDDRALHHLVAEILDNSIDEAVAGHASKITVAMHADGSIEIGDNGRGIPTAAHRKFPDKPTVEIAATKLMSGGKFKQGAYETAGGLHGVGLSVVNALSAWMHIEVARERKLADIRFERGVTTQPLRDLGAAPNRRGTLVHFLPDPEIFGAKAQLRAERVFPLVRNKAFLTKSTQILWSCDPALIGEGGSVPTAATLHFPGGVVDFLDGEVAADARLGAAMFSGSVDFSDQPGKIDWAVAWPHSEDGLTISFANTIQTPQGGTHEAGLRAALTKALKAYGDMGGVKKAAHLTPEDVMGGTFAVLSLFLPDPQFQNQTKERLNSPDATRLVETALRDRFDTWLAGQPQTARAILDAAIIRADERLAKKQDRELKRKSATKKLRLPGKLADCAKAAQEGTELFIVEGDSAGGSAKQARHRETQAVLPIRGKILNVASASADKIRANSEITDLCQALGVALGKGFDVADLRYEKIIIMTDADVDGAHIASLLMTLFYTQMRPLIEAGHLYLASPPLYRLSRSGKSVYARDDAHKDELLEREFAGKGKVDISRFKGLGEMLPAQLRATTMHPDTRNLYQVTLRDGAFAATPMVGIDIPLDHLVDKLMGKKAEHRFDFIQANAGFVQDLDV